MADDAHEEHLRQHDAILQYLTAMLVRMDGYLACVEGLRESRL